MIIAVTEITGGLPSSQVVVSAVNQRRQASKE
jgi:hypothetical protein